jgi:uncharacterized protein
MRLFPAIFFAFVLLGACSQGGQPQTGLPAAQISIDAADGPRVLTVEIAADESTREKGLMWRTQLAPDAGMLFDYHRAQPVAFWMKNTPLPLDMIFIRADGTISTIVTNTTPFSEDNIPSLEPVRAVLEINGGRAGELGLHSGDTVHAAIFGNGQ